MKVREGGRNAAGIENGRRRVAGQSGDRHRHGHAMVAMAHAGSAFDGGTPLENKSVRRFLMHVGR